MKFLRNQEGFTLVELMVVVAIVGILSAVAIPNFKKYQAKSKTTEARLQLASIYSAEIAIQNDYDSFATCLTDAGYAAPQNNYYAIGFAGANATANATVTANGGTCSSIYAYPAATNRKVGNTYALVADLTAQCATCTVPNTGDTFLAGAIGNISPESKIVGDKTKWDRWTINENKVLNHTVTGY
ncbi:MAG: hypothetical protein OHK0056_04200 [Bacteriovoracaceae bacterium]